MVTLSHLYQFQLCKVETQYGSQSETGWILSKSAWARADRNIRSVRWEKPGYSLIAKQLSNTRAKLCPDLACPLPAPESSINSPKYSCSHWLKIVQSSLSLLWLTYKDNYIVLFYVVFCVFVFCFLFWQILPSLNNILEGTFLRYTKNYKLISCLKLDLYLWRISSHKWEDGCQWFMGWFVPIPWQFNNWLLLNVW